MGTDGKSSVKCCLCRQPASMSGWCENCRTWPINITPIRWDAHGHRVDSGGFCWTCLNYVLSRLEPKPGEWIDTVRVPKLLSREENARRMHYLSAWMSSGGSLDVLITHCEDMEQNEPGIGWAKAAKDLRSRPRMDKRPVMPSEEDPYYFKPIPREVLASQKAILRDMAGQAISNGVPF